MTRRELNLTDQGSTFVNRMNASYNTVLHCDGNLLTVYVPFVIPVPKDMAYSVRYEVNRLNGELKDAQIVFEEKDERFELAAFSRREFETAPATEEVKRLMISHVDAMDAGRFRSLASAILGHATFEDAMGGMAVTDKKADGHVKLQLAGGDGHWVAESGSVSSPRFGGRLLVLATHVIDQTCPSGHSDMLLKAQTPFDEIVQEAYNHANDEDRDLIRKLRYLVCAKATKEDDNGDSIVGRMEAMGMVLSDKRALLRGE